MNIELANEAKVSASARGKIEFWAGGRTVILSKVYFISTLNVNLMWSSRLDKNSIKTNILKIQCSLFDRQNNNDLCRRIESRPLDGL